MNYSKFALITLFGLIFSVNSLTLCMEESAEEKLKTPVAIQKIKYLTPDNLTLNYKTTKNRDTIEKSNQEEFKLNPNTKELEIYFFDLSKINPEQFVKSNLSFLMINQCENLTANFFSYIPESLEKLIIVTKLQKTDIEFIELKKELKSKSLCFVLRIERKNESIKKMLKKIISIYKIPQEKMLSSIDIKRMINKN